MGIALFETESHTILRKKIVHSEKNDPFYLCKTDKIIKTIEKILLL